MTSTGSELSQYVAGSSETMDVEAVSGILASMEQKLTSLKRKAEECLDEELECTRLCKTRLDYLKCYVSGDWVKGQLWNRHYPILCLQENRQKGLRTFGRRNVWIEC